VPEAKLDNAVMGALYKVIKDPKKLWALYLDRAARWKQERALTVTCGPTSKPKSRG